MIQLDETRTFSPSASDFQLFPGQQHLSTDSTHFGPWKPHGLGSLAAQARHPQLRGSLAELRQGHARRRGFFSDSTKGFHIMNSSHAIYIYIILYNDTYLLGLRSLDFFRLLGLR